MRFGFSLFAFVACVASGCAHQESAQNADSTRREVADQELAPPQSSREGETELQIEFEESFQESLRAGELPAHVALKEDQIEHIFYLSQKYLAMNDSLLDECLQQGLSGPQCRTRAIQLGITSHLSALELVTDQLAEQMVFDVERMRSLAAEANDYQSVAQATLKGLIEYLRYTPKASRLAHNPWVETFSERHPGLQAWLPVYRHLAVRDPDRIAQLAQDPEIKEHVQHMLTTYVLRLINGKPQYITQRVDDLAETFKGYLNEADSADESLQSNLEQNHFGLVLSATNLNQITQVAKTVLKNNAVDAIAALPSRGLTGHRVLSVEHVNFANGTYSQPELPRLEDESLKFEVEHAHKILVQSSEVLKQSSHVAAPFMMLPYGAGYQNPKILEFARKFHYRLLKPVIDAYNWCDRNSASVMTRLQAQMSLHRHGLIHYRMDRTEANNNFQVFIHNQVKQGVSFKVPESTGR